jgi:hypothetical protein
MLPTRPRLCALPSSMHAAARAGIQGFAMLWPGFPLSDQLPSHVRPSLAEKCFGLSTVEPNHGGRGLPGISHQMRRVKQVRAAPVEL